MIKEWCEQSKTAVIRRRGYGRTFALIKELINATRADFPDLADDKIEIIHYGGRRYKGTFGIEFPCKSKPGGYAEIAQLEYTG